MAWVDGRGLHVEVAGQPAIDVTPPVSSLIGEGCLLGTILGPRRAIIEQPAGFFVIDAAGVQPLRLPALQPSERIKAINFDGVLTLNGGDTTRVVDGEGAAVRRVYGPRETVLGGIEATQLVLNDGRRIPFEGEVVGARGNGDAFLLTLGHPATLKPEECGSQVQVLIGPLTITLRNDERAWLDDGGAVIASGHTVRVLKQGQPDREIFSAAVAHDLTGQPLHERMYSSFSYDTFTHQLLVSERLRDAQCNVWDNIALVDSGGRISLVASGPLSRLGALISDGVISYVEYPLSYEATSSLTASP